MPIGHRVEQALRYALSSGADERHALRTADALRRMGADDDLISAGLLHDLAKPRETRLWHRIAAVILDAVAPAARARIARGDGTFARYLDHARRGAQPRARPDPGAAPAAERQGDRARRDRVERRTRDQHGPTSACNHASFSAIHR